MARDMSQLVERMRDGRDLVLTEDGQIVSPEATGSQDSAPEQQTGSAPQGNGVLLKPERFGG